MPFFFNSGAGRIVSGARRPPPPALSLRLLFLKPLRLEIKRKLANRLERVNLWIYIQQINGNAVTEVSLKPIFILVGERDISLASCIKTGTPLLWKQIGLNSWRIDSDFFNLVDCCLTQAMKLEAIINQKNSNSHGGDIAAVLLLHFCPAAAAEFLCCCCSCCRVLLCCCCILLLLMVLLHYYSAAAAAFRPAAAAATLCCCVLLLLQLRFANAAAVFCCCCSLLRGSNPMVLTGSLAWEGTNSHNCGLIISSIKTNSTKEISNHDQVTLDLGRLPRACYLGDSGKRDLRKKEDICHQEYDMTRDLLEYGKSILFLGRPGVGKTTVIRGISHVLSYELLKRVIVVDTSNEIGGDGDIPHPAIGGARRLQVPDPCMKHKVMIEAVDNHMPEIVVDTSNEIGGDGDIPHPAIGGARRLQVPDPCMKHKVMIEAVDNHMPEVIIVELANC
ncbi:putative protein ycf45 [Sesamum angolense]|uniref:AAA+ ATPase domain-containing protein n=2 Tax=Sesamum TaxID=4181 RepID=A0AAE1T9G3_9LAMI|nr:putative protein ycf45 [Sesamum angolense]